MHYQAFFFCLDLNNFKEKVLVKPHHLTDRTLAKLPTFVIILHTIFFLLVMVTKTVAAWSTVCLLMFWTNPRRFRILYSVPFMGWYAYRIPMFQFITLLEKSYSPNVRQTVADINNHKHVPTLRGITNYYYFSKNYTTQINSHPKIHEATQGKEGSH